MLIERNGEAPRVAPEASIAGSAHIVGNVQIGACAQASLHEQVMTTLLEEIHGWRDKPLPPEQPR